MDGSRQVLGGRAPHAGVRPASPLVRDTIARMESAVTEQRLEPGTVWGSLSTLRAEFGVSRPVLHAALRVLERGRVVSLEPGPRGARLVRVGPGAPRDTRRSAPVESATEAIRLGLARSGVERRADAEAQRYVGDVLAGLAERFGRIVGDLLDRGVGLDRLGDSGALVERMAAAVPRVHPFDDYGPYYTITDVSTWTGKRRQAVHQRIQRRGLLGMQTSDGVTVLPAWQFAADGEPVPRLKEVLDALAGGTDDPWTWAQWLTAPHADDDRRPTWQVLAAGGEAAAGVVADARADARRWSR